MAILNTIIDGKTFSFEIKDVAPITFSDMIERARYNKSVFLSLIVVDPQLSANEWYSKVPANISDKFFEEIIKYRDDNYVR